MYKVYFYKDKRGKEPVLEYIKELAKKNDKDSRIKLNKIQDYIEILAQHGTKAGEPFIKYLGDDIWELRPLRDRILFVVFINNSYVLLHQFMKSTQKTPKKEIEKAKKEYKDLLSRSDDYE